MFGTDYNDKSGRPILNGIDDLKKGDWLVQRCPGEMHDYLRMYRIIERTSKRITISAEMFDTDYGTITKNAQLQVRPIKDWDKFHVGPQRYIAENKSRHITLYTFMTQEQLEADFEPSGGWCD